jgi:hypothetical protein
MLHARRALLRARGCFGLAALRKAQFTMLPRYLVLCARIVTNSAIIRSPIGFSRMAITVRYDYVIIKY